MFVNLWSRYAPVSEGYTQIGQKEEWEHFDILI